MENCGASPADIAEALNGAKVLHEATKANEAPKEVQLVEEAHTQGDAKSRADDGAAPEPPDCKGQNHHIISRPIAKALTDHQLLRRLYKPRDPRFMTQAKDEESHCGYQEWHRKVDREVIEWLNTYPKATRIDFEKFLHEIYSRPAMLERFPHGF